MFKQLNANLKWSQSMTDFKLIQMNLEQTNFVRNFRLIKQSFGNKGLGLRVESVLFKSTKASDKR